MAIVLLQFVVILLVVILGFAMALYPLLRDADTFTFGDILLLLFKTLLGDVEAFEEFGDSARNRYSSIGNVLLVLYLVVMTIMLLNLLIAVLSTAHAKVEMNSDKELEVSKVRVVEHYRLIVALDVLPAPFNLVQFILNLPFNLMRQSGERMKIRRKIDRTVGQVSFWLVLSPIAVTFGTILWVASSVNTLFVPATELVSRVPSASTLKESLSGGASSNKGFATILFRLYSLLFPGRESLQSAERLVKSKAIRLRIGVGGFCAMGAPLCLLFLWLREPCLQMFQVITHLAYLIGGSSSSRPSGGDNVEADVQSASTLEATGDAPQLSRPDNADAKVHSLLESAGVKASVLQKYTEDPLIDPEVRPGEVELSTTVEHLKLLRNLLEKKVDDLGKDLKKKFSERVDYLDKKVGDLGEGLDKKVRGFGEGLGELGKRVNCLEKKVDNLGEGLEKTFSDRVDCLDKKVGDLGEGLGEFGKRVNCLEKKVDDLGEGLEKTFSDRVDCLERNFNSFKDELLDILRGNERFVGK